VSRRTASTRPGSFRSALAHHDYRWLFISSAVSFMGSWAYNVALAVFVYQATGSPAWVGATTIGRFVPALLMSSYGGVVAERFERRRLMAVLDLTSAVLMGLLAVVTWLGGPVALAIAVAACTSIVATAYQPAVKAMIPQLVGEDDLAAANSLDSVVENAAVIAGPGIGALLLVLWTPSATILVNGLTFLFSAWGVTRIRARSRATDVTEGGTAGLWRQMTVGFKAIAQSSAAAVLVAFSVFASFLYGTDTVLFVVLSKDRLGTGPEGYGYLLAALGVGGLLGAPLIGRLSSLPRLGLVISVSMVVYAAPDLVLTVVHRPWIAFVLVVIRGAGTLVVDVLAVTALQRSLPGDRIARVFGVFFALVLGAIALGALVTPALLSTFGLDATLATYGIGVPLLVVVAYPKVVGIDRIAAARLTELSPRIELLEGLGILAAASRNAVERLAAAVTDQVVAAGTRIIQEGDVADAFYVIVDGQVSVSALGERGAETFIRTMGPGEYVGEIGLIEQSARTASVDAATECRLYRIDGDTFLAALSEGRASASFLEGAGNRLGVTHPSRRLTVAALAGGDGGER